ncbi:NAD-dependent epimerase/dehydratase family protein [Pseudomonas luteola]|uniref:NAD-dependent epimerase/dehydratase family protein n=1 Tax=Pseudomonas luteola TaxID=47886 RepID=UPI00388F5EB3
MSNLLKCGRNPIALVRQASGVPDEVPFKISDDFSSELAILSDIDVVVHCAARVHVMDDKELDPLAAYRQTNVIDTLALARNAAIAGVKRFIFLSTIKVNGDSTAGRRPFSSQDISAPNDPYGLSKYEAECALQNLSRATGMEVVIIRPVLVYGPGVKANFLNVMSLLYRRVPLPLGSVHNKRSFVAIENLVNLIICCMDHPAAANEVFFASDDDDISTSDLLRRLGGFLGRPARLLPVPVFLLEKGAHMLGKQAFAQRLFGSLQVDISRTRDLLQWSPVVTLDEALKQTAEHFLKNSNHLLK